MNLQLFDDGARAGSAGAQGGSTGNENGGQNSAGSAAGAHGAGTYTYEQLEEIANARVERSERTALANFFRSQGMTEAEVTQAISDFKTQRAANQPNTEQLQQERDDALKEVSQMRNEKVLTSKGVKVDDLDYVMFKVSKLVDGKTDFEKAADKFLKENPRFAEKSSGAYRVSTGAQSGGAGGKENSNDFINAAIRKAAGR
ncbi:MAG: hypothetical protein KHZ72_01555 [Lachnospiraceae bacterium]|nr:hypothetical protein [Lachnospiraceae bacterium]